MGRTMSSEPPSTSASDACAHDPERRDKVSDTPPTRIEPAEATDEVSSVSGNVSESVPADRSGLQARWWAAVVVGLIGAIPLAWLLSYAGALPYFLGIFFFLLFGIVLGATMHRVASPGRPYRLASLVAGTTIVVVVGWAGAVVIEGLEFPTDMGMKATRTPRRIPDVHAYRADVAKEVRRFLRTEHPPGGPLGYVRWIVTDGEIAKGQLTGVNRTLRRSPRKVWWAVQMVLALGLFAFGVGSQTLPLRLAREHAVRAMDDVDTAGC